MALSMAMVALGPGAKLSLADIQRDLVKTWPDLPRPEHSDDKEVTLSFRMGPADVILGHMPAPIPWGDLEGPCATSWLWPESAKTLKTHTAHLIVTVNGDLEPIDRARLLTQVIAAILGTCKAALGVFWTDAALVVSAPVFRDFAVEVLPAGPPVYLWVDFRIGRNKDGLMSGYTVGLDALGLMELETLNSPEPPGELRERLSGLAGYLIENGLVINDGDTVGEDANERIRVTYSPSSFGLPTRVMRLDYPATKAKKRW